MRMKAFQDRVRHWRGSDPSALEASRYPKQGDGLVQVGLSHP